MSLKKCFSPGEVSDERFLLSPCELHSLSAGCWGFFFLYLWYAHGGGKPGQQNLPSHPPLQVEECALWQTFSEFLISRTTTPKQHRISGLTG